MCICHALRHSKIASRARKQIWTKCSMDLPESIIKQYVVSPQPLNYPPAKSCTAKKVNLETSRLRLKKQRERQRAKKRAARQLLPEFKRSQCNSKLEQVMDVNSIRMLLTIFSYLRLLTQTSYLLIQHQSLVNLMSWKCQIL